MPEVCEFCGHATYCPCRSANAARRLCGKCEGERVMGIEKTISELKMFEAPQRPNFITAHTMQDREHVVVQMHLQGNRGQWIEYDAEQLDELIRMLQAHRDDLR